MIRVVGTLTALAFLVPFAVKAEGRNTGAADRDLMIGTITTYATEGGARAACGKDPVVWADRHAGTYYRPNEKEYGSKGEGSFACLHDARRGNYWDTSPLSSMAHKHGRSFPFTPIAPPDWGS